ncbi:hypothetical protein KY316_01155, partial [Candidatus Woesearchaeota archaeon]|nr:hypothetical protein [Candidatus Woesearchaeota archaeon]
FGLLNKNVAGCSIDDGEFHSCGSGLWWNQRLQALIYDKKNNIDLDGNIFSQMYNFLLHWVYDLFDIELPISVGERTVEFLARARLLNEIYVSKHDDRLIRAFVEPKYEFGEIKQFFTATYEGFDISVCESVDTYDWFVANQFEGVSEQDVFCTDVNGTETVFAVDKAAGPEEFDKLVSLLTRQTRIE